MTNRRIQELLPPKLSVQTIQQKLACTRPMREGAPNISIEGHGLNKVIVNCYGHGGSGWTLLFGSVEKAIGLFVSSNPSKKEPVRVIGAGCMGLLCAVELQRKGYNVVGVTAAEFINLPSWMAAGYFALVSLKTTPDAVDEVENLGMRTFMGYEMIHKGNHPYFSSDSIRFLPVYCDRDVDSGVDYLAQRGMVPNVEEVTLNFVGGAKHEGYLKYMTYFINGSKLMQILWDELNRRGVRVEAGKIDSFEEVKENILFNCTGMGAAVLNNDKALLPIKGHLVTLNQNSGKGHMDYMIHADVMQDGKKERMYLFPKNLSVSPEHPKGLACAGVLGGTFLDEKKNKIDDALEYDKILNRASMFFYGRENYE